MDIDLDRDKAQYELLNIFRGVLRNKVFSQKHSNYIECKSIKEAEKWAKQNLNIDNVNFSGINIKVANCINKQMKILKEMYPEVSTIKHLSTLNVKWYDDYSNWKIKSIMNSYKLSDSYYQEAENIFYKNYDFNYRINHIFAIAISDSEKYNGIYLNRLKIRNYYSLLDKLRNDEKEKYTVICGRSVEAFITHEFGHHVLSFLECNNSSGFVDEYWENINSIGNKDEVNSYIKLNLSECGAINKKEFFAEALKEYIHNPNPRPIAKYLGDKLQSILIEHRQSNSL